MNPSVDVNLVGIASLVLVFVFRVAITTPSRVVRFGVTTLALTLLVLMMWNLYTHGGFHAI